MIVVAMEAVGVFALMIELEVVETRMGMMNRYLQDQGGGGGVIKLSKEYAEFESFVQVGQ